MPGSIRKICVLFTLLLVYAGVHGRSLEEIKRSGVIYVAFTTADLRNINYDLALELARYLKVELKVVEITWEEAFRLNGSIPEDMETDPDLRYTPDAFNKADIICSTFTVNEWRKKIFGFAETFYTAELLLINKNEEDPDEFGDLAGKRIAFMGATTFEQHLLEINTSLDEKMQLVRTANSEESLRLLEKEKVYGIVLDSDEALTFNARSDMQYKIAFPISDVTRSAWAIERNNPLRQEVENFFETIAGNGVLDEIFFQRFGITYKAYLDQLNSNLEPERYHRDLDEILASKKLVVALRERDFVYHENGQKQFMHVLAEEFADYLGVSLEFVITPSFGEYWKTKDGIIVRDSSYTPEWFNYFDLACETIAPLDWRGDKVNMIPIYPSDYTVVARKDLDISSIDDLKNYRGVTGIGTSYEDILRSNGITNFYYENVNNYIRDIVDGKADYTIIYNVFIELSAYPELEAKLELGSLEVSWALRKDQPELHKEIENFISTSREEGLIGVLIKALKGNTLQTPQAFIQSYYESFQTGQLPYVDYGAADGLPQEDIFSIFQDQNGYMWFGTNLGAVRYNGREMTVFNHEHGLPANSVRDIKQDSSGFMYFATTNGIAKFHGERTVETFLEGVAFNKIFVDSRNIPWFIGDDGVFMREKKGSTRHLNSELLALPRVIHNITEDRGTGNMLIATIAGVFMYNIENHRITQLSDTDCYSLYVDDHDSLWISTRDGLLITGMNDLKENSSDAVFQNLNKRLHFPTDIISDIISNPLGSVWLLTSSTVMQLISTDQAPIVYENEIGIMNNKILSLLVDHENNIWIGFSGGLQRLTNNQGLRNFYPEMIDSYVYSVFQDDMNRTWITSDNGVFYFQEGELLNFTQGKGMSNTKFTGTILPNNNILLANSNGLYEVSCLTLEIVNHNPFSHIAHILENIFITGQGEIFLLTGINGIIYYFPDFNSEPAELKNRYTSNIFQLIELNGRVIGGNNTGFVSFNGEAFELLQESDCSIWSLHMEDDKIWVGTDCGIGLVTGNRFDEMELTTFDRALVIKSILPAKNRNYLWLGTNKGFSYFNKESRGFEFTVNAKDGLSGDEVTQGGLFLDNHDLLWVGTYHGISNFNIKARSSLTNTPVCHIEKMLLNGEQVEAESGKSFSHRENNLIFEISALSFSDETSVEYEYYLRGTGNQYSAYHRGSEYRANFNNLPPGKYEFIYKAKGKDNVWGYSEKFEFSIRKAWYNTWIFRLLAVTLFLLLGYMADLLRVKVITNQKNRLEHQVKERTFELEEANREIEAKRDKIENQLEEIETQRDQIVAQRDLVIKQKQAITDSITYAQKIQSAILPSQTTIQNFFAEHFIIFQPRDIVSGDFYWFKEIENSMVIVGADCTGHGIPGAFMSMLGVTLLNEGLGDSSMIKPSEILGHLRIKVKELLAQEGKAEDQKDGMDMAFVLIDKTNPQLQYAGANFPLYLIRKKNGIVEGELEPYLSLENNHYQLFEMKGDKQPIGVHWDERGFTNHVIKPQSQDAIYIFSDGFVDQFGGEKRKKYKSVNFKKLLLSIQEESMEKQKLLIEKAFENWRGKIEQIDDVSVIGLRI